MWANFVLLLCQHFIFSSANNVSVPHTSAQIDSATSATAFLADNSSTTFGSSTPLTTNLQNTTAAIHSKADAKTNSSLSSFSPTMFTNTSHLASTVLPIAPLNHTSQRATTVLSTPAPDITSNSSVMVTSYSPNMTNSSSQSDNATSTTYSPLTNSTAQTTSLHTFATNTSFTSSEPTSLPNGTGQKEVTTVKVPAITFTVPAASTTILPSSSLTSLPSTGLSTNRMEKKIATLSNAGTAATVVVSLILIAVGLLGLVMYLKKRRVFYSRLQEDNPTGSWSNYNNPVFEDS
uniref:prostate androgen-regulated mucin-like protein 1 homolog n=1 Tax=Pristiophorus japonicus TaxID=55135 RepID=UPI00398E721E